MSERMIDEVFAFVRQVANCETSDQGNIRTARELVKRLESSATDPTSPQTPREALALAMIAARERRVTETHNDVLPIYLFGFDDATEAALEAIAALPRCSDETARAFARLFPDYKQAGFTGGQAADFEILKRALSLSRPMRGGE